ncbi:sulfotransferase family protein [Novosphingobium lentum]|uniref:sulfotransferase family protein n=1 Tax=Novosphingobium lentum TaxID=145287 RepID=UPI00082FB1A9|nr:sulfotransferase [Novosphingobium lentum]
MSDDIRIDDLAAPVLSEIERATVASAPPMDLTPDLVLGAAMAETGLSNFGADDFRERLGVWLQALDEDRGQNDFGRASSVQSLIRFAANRLKIEDVLAREPQILDTPIDRPIIIAGLPRSGTTHLVNTIARHPGLRSMELWETNEPVPRDDERNWASDDSNPRFVRSNDVWHVMNNVLQHWSAMHEWAPGHVHEECELQSFDFSSYMLDWFARVPRWQQYYCDHDQTPHYLYARKVVQIMTWYKGPNRWVMKSPPNMENLPAVFAAYPDATVAITHRDPVAVLQSAITMMAYLDRLRRKDADLPGLAQYWINRIERLLRKCIADRARIPQDKVIDVMFHEFLADQRGTVDAICARADLPVDAAASAAIGGFLDDNRRHRHGRVAYDLAGQFGVDIAALRRRFQFYYDRFPVQQERVSGEAA